MLVYIHPTVGVWLSEEELNFVRRVKAAGQILYSELTFDQLAIFNKLQAKAILRRRKHENTTYIQVRHSLSNLVF